MANFKHLKQYHFIYKTTNLLNNKYYLGMHSTNDLNDNYIGSGTHLWHAIRKYGKKNFKIEILEFLSSREELVKREKQVINEDLLKDKSCMNLKVGGEGGLSNKEHAYKFHSAGGKSTIQLLHKKFRTDPEYRQSNINKISNALKGRVGTFKGKTHSNQTKSLISQVMKGKGIANKNSQFGTMWITNGKQNKKVRIGELIEKGWIEGRKIKI